jgi:primosomal protein N' (replication factor Y)
MCHLCGHIEAPPERCRTLRARASCCTGARAPSGSSWRCSKEIPQARVLRLDRDTSRGQGAARHVWPAFRQREADILVGTQMLSKGHDFPGVTLVGILQADHGLGMPDLRAAERTFQLLTQVSGRAGRGDRAGRVLMQAYAVNHPAIVCAAQHDFTGFAAWELEKRQRAGEPAVRVSGACADLGGGRGGGAAAGGRGRLRWCGRGWRRRRAIRAAEGERSLSLLGPVPSPIERVNRRIRWQLLIRSNVRPALRWLLKQVRRSSASTGRATSRPARSSMSIRRRCTDHGE